MPVESVTSGRAAPSVQPTQAYQPGQVVRGQLVERLPGDLWRVRLGQAETTARFQGSLPTQGPFQARVSATTPQLTLQLITSEALKAQDLGRAGMPSSTALGQMARLLAALSPEAASRLFPELNWSEGATLAPQLGQWIQSFGFFFESRLATLLAELFEAFPLATPRQLKDQAELKRLMEGDIKPLLLRLKGALESRDDAASRQLAGRIERWLQGYSPDGNGLFTLPLPWPGGEARLSFKLPRRDAEPVSWQIGVDLDSPTLGLLRLDFLLAQGGLTLRLAAEQSDTETRFQDALPPLHAALDGLFPRVDIRVGEWGERVVIRPPQLDIRG